MGIAENKRTLKELFEVVKQYHHYFNPAASTPFMCMAAASAFINDEVSEEELAEVEKACLRLVRKYSPCSESLESALECAGVEVGEHMGPMAQKVVVRVWEEYFETL